MRSTKTRERSDSKCKNPLQATSPASAPSKYVVVGPIFCRFCFRTVYFGTLFGPNQQSRVCVVSSLSPTPQLALPMQPGAPPRIPG